MQELCGTNEPLKNICAETYMTRSRSLKTLKIKALKSALRKSEPIPSWRHAPSRNVYKYKITYKLTFIPNVLRQRNVQTIEALATLALSRCTEAANKLKSTDLRSSGGCEVESKYFGQPLPCLGLPNQVKVHREPEALCTWFAGAIIHLELEMRSWQWQVTVWSRSNLNWVMIRIWMAL